MFDDDKHAYGHTIAVLKHEYIYKKLNFDMLVFQDDNTSSYVFFIVKHYSKISNDVTNKT